MPSSPQKTTQYTFGPGANSQGDMMQFRGPGNIILSWIDYNGIGQGNLASSGNVAFADAEVPSGSTPGTSFSLAHAPSPAASLILVWNGETLLQNTDYTLSGSSLTLTQTVQSGDSFVCWYRH